MIPPSLRGGGGSPTFLSNGAGGSLIPPFEGGQGGLIPLSNGALGSLIPPFEGGQGGAGLGLICTIGVFDGVHRGHRLLFEQLQSLARAEGLQPVIYTFRQHPLEVLRGQAPAMLTTLEERVAMLQQFAEVRLLDFREVQHLTAEDFMHRLHDEDGVQTLLMGYDHRFGSDRLTDFADYQRLAARVGLRIHHATECLDEGLPVSSSRIRKLIEQGQIEDANRLLGYPYAISGMVVHGNGIGSTLGFPTANIAYSPSKLLPLSGVYSATVDIQDSPSSSDANKEDSLTSTAGTIQNLFPLFEGGRGSLPSSPEGVRGSLPGDADALVRGIKECSNRKNAVVNIGTNPTVGNTRTTVEAHLLDFSGSLYNHTLTIHFQHFIRPERRFSSLAALTAQIRSDLRTAFPATLD